MENNNKVSRTDIYNIPPHMIYIENENVRENYPQEKFDILKESIKLNGVMEPVHVRKTAKGYALTHGFNRMKAVWELIGEGVEITGVKAIPSKVSAEEELVRHITLNSGEPLTKFEISKILVKLQGYGWKNKDIAAKLGYSEQEVSNLITFQNQASMELKNAVKDGIMGINPAISLIRETDGTDEQNKILSEAKEKVSGEKRKKIKSNDVLSKKLSFQDKYKKAIDLMKQGEESEDMKIIIEFYQMLMEKNSTAESIVEKMKNVIA